MSKFFVIDGTDGSGKGTQTNLIKERLEKQGFDVLLADFPQYGKKSAALVEEYLNGSFGAAHEVDAYQASSFYAVDRFAAKKEMQEHLDRGGVVISNRYVSANQIHQSGKISDPEELEKFLQWLDHHEYEVMGIPRPDRVFFLDVPPVVSDILVEKKEHREYIEGEKAKDIHEADPQHILDAYNRARQLVDKYDEWVHVECLNESGTMRSIENINQELFEIISQEIN